MDKLFAFLNKRGEAIVVLLILLAGTLFCIALLSSGDLASQIGETIGSITAPILSFSGIVLLYLTFREHTQSIRIQEEALREQRSREDAAALIQLLDGIQDYLRQTVFIHPDTGAEHRGFAAFSVFAERLRAAGSVRLKVPDETMRGLLLSVRSMVRSIQVYLERNATAGTALSPERRLANYNDLDIFRAPLESVVDSCAAYVRNVLPEYPLQMELIAAIASLKPALDEAFDQFRPGTQSASGSTV